MRQLATLVVFALLWLLASRDAAAQQSAGKIALVGVLGERPGPVLKGLREKLAQLGYIEGQNLHLEYRGAEGRADRYPVFAAELTRLPPDILVAIGTQAAAALRQATARIPVVMTLIGDPIGSGLVTNLTHPGENITGFSALVAELEPKRLELLKQLAPGLSRVAVLDPAIPGTGSTDYLAQAASSLGMTIAPIRVPPGGDIDFATVLAEHPGAVLGVSNLGFTGKRGPLISFLTENRLLAASADREFVVQGGLLSYAPDTMDAGRQAAGYVDKILKGAKPGDLPVQQPTTFDLVINLTTAKAIGVTVPQELLQRADEVIELPD